MLYKNFMILHIRMFLAKCPILKNYGSIKEYIRDMNKEQRTFRKVMKERRRKESFKRQSKDSHGTPIPINEIPARKSRKYKEKKKK